MQPLSNQQLAIKANEARILGLTMVHDAASGHPGGSMSCLDLVTALYFNVMHVDTQNPQDPDRDRFVMSKGHCSPALYPVLALRGFFPVDDLHMFRRIDGHMSGHVEMHHVRGVDMSTGSLGQGASAAAGAALGNKVDGRTNHVFCVVGDGEADEGEVWEAFQFAYAHKLDNLVYFIDKNGYQLDGPTADILDHGNIAKKAESFGLYTQEIDGHDVKAIYDAIQNAYTKKGVPSCIVLDTSKGKGATFAEPKHDHSSQPSEEQWAEAIAASEKALEAIKNA